MRIRLNKSDAVKKANNKMWRHIVTNWLQFKFNHSPNSAYMMDSKNHLSGDITDVFCNCGKHYHTDK